MAAMFETWLQNPWTVGLATNVITTGILTGSAKLWNKYHRKTPTQRPSVTPSISPEELFSTRAGSTIVQHYSIYETLMPLNLVVTETHLPYGPSDHRRLRGPKWSRSLLAGLPAHRPAFWAAYRSSRWCSSSSHCCLGSPGASNNKTRLKPMLTSSAIRATLPCTPARV